MLSDVDSYLNNTFYSELYSNIKISCDLILDQKFFNKNIVENSEVDLICYEELQNSDDEN